MHAQSNFRLLIVRLGAMGDILHALPAVTALRLAHPGWQIGWVVEPRWQALLRAGNEEAGNGEAGNEEAGNEEAGNEEAGNGEAGNGEAGNEEAGNEEAGNEEAGNREQGTGYRNGRVAKLQERDAALAVRDSAMPVVDRLHFAPSREWKRQPLSAETRKAIGDLRSELRGAEYNAVLDLQGAIRSAVIARMSGCPRRIGEAHPREWPAQWLFTERVVTHGAHVIEQDMELASAVAGDALSAVAPLLPTDPKAEAWCSEWLATTFPGAARPIALIAPGAGWGAKRWPPERYAAVVTGLAARGLHVVVNAGPGEETIAAAIAPGGAVAVTPTLPQLIALTRRVALCIGGDTGPLHLASALGRPVVGIYGPTDPSRNGPYGTRARVLRTPESKRDHSRREAPESGLLKITPEDVLRAADELLDEESAR